MCGKSDKNKINCQCDGNCDCGEVLPNGMISCDNCGWKAPEAYNGLTGSHVCPSCRTESPYSNDVKPKNKTMKQTNQTRENLSEGLVGLATANAGFLNWSNDPLGKDKGVSNTESNFANDISSQNMVGYAIGQDWTILNPFGKGGSESGFTERLSKLSDEDKKWAAMFYAATQEFDNAESTGESGFTFGEKLKEFVSSATPAGVLQRDVWAGKYCKSLGYMKSADKTAFKKCTNATKINFVKAKKGQWTYPASPEGIEESISPEELAAQTAQEVASIPPSQMADAAMRTGDVQVPAKSNTMLYVGIAVVVFVLIIVAIIVIMRMRNKQQAA